MVLSSGSLATGRLVRADDPVEPQVAPGDRKRRSAGVRPRSEVVCRPMHARIVDGAKLRTTTDLGEIRAAIKGGERVWIDLERQTKEADELLQDVLGLHPLTIEDIWTDHSQPKVDDFDSYLYLRVQGIGAAK